MTLAAAARALPLLLVAQVALAGSDSRPRPYVAGQYTSNWDDVSLVQDGTRIHGTYVCCGGGTIEGRIIEGRIIRYQWHEPRGAGDGSGVWTITASGRLEGTWGHGTSVDDGGPWNLEVKGQGPTLAR